jgi:hypothetical protein
MMAICSTRSTPGIIGIYGLPDKACGGCPDRAGRVLRNGRA